MTVHGQRILKDILFACYSLFIFASISSIAVAQIGLGLSLAVFLFGQIWWRENPFPKPLRPFYWAVVAYVAWLFVAALASPDFLIGADHIREEWLFCAVPIGIFLFADDRYRTKLTGVFVVGLLVIGLYGALQHYTGVYWFKSSPPLPAGENTYRIFGGFSMRITFGNYMATATVFVLIWSILRLRQSPRWMVITGLIGSVLGTLAAVWSYSRGSVAGMFVAVGIGALTTGWKRSAIIISVLVVVLIGVLVGAPTLTDRIKQTVDKDLSSEYEGGRIFIWKNSLDIALSSPIVGVGPGFFPRNYEARLRPDIPEYRKLSHAHNDFLNLFATSGLPGMLTFVAIWGILIGTLWRGYRSGELSPEAAAYCGAALASSVTFLFTSLFEATFNDEEVRQMLMFVWAAGLWPMYKKAVRPAVAEPERS